MREDARSCVIHLAESRSQIPGPRGEHATRVLRHGTLDLALSVPRTSVLQTPHAQDEVYVVVRGRGVVKHAGEGDEVEPGDVVFVAAGAEHQLEGFDDEFAVWRIFYGPDGGEPTTSQCT